MLRSLLLLGSIVTVAFSQPLDYPKARKGDVVDDYSGTKVSDPYRWLEDTDSPETATWVKAENALTSAYLEKLPDLARFRQELTKLLNYPRYTVPTWKGSSLLVPKERRAAKSERDLHAGGARR